MADNEATRRIEASSIPPRRNDEGAASWRVKSDVTQSGDAPTRSRVALLDPAMLELEQTVTRVARAPVSVLILGETGVGKELVAAMLHDRSLRHAMPYVRLNCASLPEALLESELFGHERGAFTGAVSTKRGLLEVADGGTVFLDEIGDLPLALQGKLLRAIEARETTRIGGTRCLHIDVRFVAATHRELERDVGKGHFRRDLLYRINCVTLNVPPLRDRPLDIEPLARFFAEQAAAHFGTPRVTFSAAAIAALSAHAWPGNVRELRNVVERAALLSTSLVVEPSHLALPSQSGEYEIRLPVLDELPGSLPTAGLEQAERLRIAAALRDCGGNQSRAAKLLGLSRRTLVRRIARLGLPRPRA
jgi:two-component system, NtrC family, response regulator AtoC